MTVPTNFVFPGSSDTYVPTLSADLVISFSRNPNKFPLNQYIDYRPVTKMKGLWTLVNNDGGGRVLNSTDNVWADGSLSPSIVNGNTAFTFPEYTCTRRRLPKTIGNLAIEQGGFDVLGLEARKLAMQMMTARVLRCHTTLTTPANWGSNYSTSTNLGAGPWASATATNSYIRKSLATAQIAIEQQTYGSVSAGDLYLIMNPTTAAAVATSQEYLNFVAQNPVSIPIWENQKQFRLYGIPDQLMGLNVIVDNTSYSNSAITYNPSATLNFTFPSNYALLMTKQKAINQGETAFSTFSPFLYEEFITEQFQEPEHRLTKVYVTESIDDSAAALVAPQSGYLINIAA